MFTFELALRRLWLVYAVPHRPDRLTDLATVSFGLGVLTANAAFDLRPQFIQCYT
jgi:hypothetical protein